MSMTKTERAERVNRMISAMGNHGRRFFYSKDKDCYARIEVDGRGRVWWTDEYTNKRIYTHYKYRWRGFSNGGTLQDLVIAFRNYIAKGEPINPGYFGPWPDWYCKGDLWGYGKDSMDLVREAAVSIGLIPSGG